ncbi:hypothetical protein [Candidatus Chlorohelix sp.]|uniref:hypothetical protein n=1 Tax=Candidatus Chlorohelix sp. TaxID=3139201 RepID=UPI0030204348
MEKTPITAKKWHMNKNKRSFLLGCCESGFPDLAVSIPAIIMKRKIVGKTFNSGFDFSLVLCNKSVRRNKANKAITKNSLTNNVLRRITNLFSNDLLPNFNYFAQILRGLNLLLQ